MIRVGILSDTHLHDPSPAFEHQCALAFDDCDAIVHAGDLIDSTILNTFKDKDIYAVCGNMCNRKTQQHLPEEKCFVLAGYAIAVTHGTGSRHNIEERMFEKFPHADCIIFGHTHQPVINKFGTTLVLNPGSFQSTGPHGAPGTYAIMTIDGDGLRAAIHTLPQLL